MKHNIPEIDRENKNLLVDVMLKEHKRAAEIFSKIYHTNYYED